MSSQKFGQMKQAVPTTRHLKDVAATFIANSTGLNLYELCNRVYCMYLSLPSKEAMSDLPILYKRFFEIDLAYLKKIPWIERCVFCDNLLPSLTAEEESLLDETVRSRLNFLHQFLFAVPIVQIVALLCGHRIPLKCILLCWMCFFYLAYRMLMKPCSLPPGMVRDESPSQPNLQFEEDEDADSIFTGVQQLFDESNYFGAR